MKMDTVEIPLNKGMVALVDAEHAHLVHGYIWYSHHGHAARTVNSNGFTSTVYIHRQLWEAINGPIPDDRTIDHKNRIKTDNRMENLRLATTREQGQNRSDNHNGTTTSKYVGISWHKHAQKWEAHIRINGVQCHLGLFDDEQIAAESYQRVAAEVERVEAEKVKL